MIDYGSYAVLGLGGETFGGRPGRSLHTLRPAKEEGAELWMLRLLPGAIDARFEGGETVRGTLCRKYAVQVEVARAEAVAGARLSTPSDVDTGIPPVLVLMVWTDGQHIRRAQFGDRSPEDPQPGLSATSVGKVRTLELWDFGVSVKELDWSRLPGVPDARLTPHGPDDH